MLYFPSNGQSYMEGNLGTPNAVGTQISAPSTTHTKNTTYTTLIAATAYTSYGVMVSTVNSTTQRYVIDIAIGEATFEQIIIPDLVSFEPTTLIAINQSPHYWYFPITIPAGSRISARSQAGVTFATTRVALYLFENPIPGQWYGSRVTAYGVDLAASNGTSHTSTNNTSAYATTTQLTASTTNPIKYMQLSVDHLTDTFSSADLRGLLRIAAGSSTNYVASDLPIRENVTTDATQFNMANFILSQMSFNIPAGSYLGIGAMYGTGGAEARGYSIYGVD